jgi:hypothetical protein
MIDVAAAAHAQTVQVTVVQSELGAQFVCGACDRTSEPWPLDTSIALMAGHVLSHLDPTYESDID